MPVGEVHRHAVVRRRVDVDVVDLTELHERRRVRRRVARVPLGLVPRDVRALVVRRRVLRALQGDGGEGSGLRRSVALGLAACLGLDDAFSHLDGLHHRRRLGAHHDRHQRLRGDGRSTGQSAGRAAEHALDRDLAGRLPGDLGLVDDVALVPDLHHDLEHLVDVSAHAVLARLDDGVARAVDGDVAHDGVVGLDVTGHDQVEDVLVQVQLLVPLQDGGPLLDLPLEAADELAELAGVADHRADLGDDEAGPVGLLRDRLGLLGALGVLDLDPGRVLDGLVGHRDVVVGVPPRQLRCALDQCSGGGGSRRLERGLGVRTGDELDSRRRHLALVDTLLLGTGRVGLDLVGREGGARGRLAGDVQGHPVLLDPVVLLGHSGLLGRSGPVGRRLSGLGSRAGCRTVLGADGLEAHQTGQYRDEAHHHDELHGGSLEKQEHLDPSFRGTVCRHDAGLSRLP